MACGRLYHHRPTNFPGTFSTLGKALASGEGRHIKPGCRQRGAHLKLVSKPFGTLEPNTGQPQLFADPCNYSHCAIGLVGHHSIGQQLTRARQQGITSIDSQWHKLIGQHSPGAVGVTVTNHHSMANTTGTLDEWHLKPATGHNPNRFLFRHQRPHLSREARWRPVETCLHSEPPPWSAPG